MKTSVYIPVDNNSMDLLSSIVELYNIGEFPPDEIIINACGIDDEKSLGILKQIHEKNHKNVKIFARKTYDSVPDNVNYAKSLTNHEIVLLHDPKVLPSVKRCEIVKNYMTDCDVKVVHHTSYNFDVFFDDSVPVKYKNIVKSYDLYTRYFPFGEKLHAWQYTRRYGQEFGAQWVDINSVCVRREVLDEFEFKNDYGWELYRGNGDGMGYEFALETLYKYKRSEILNIPLTIVN